MSSHNSFAYNLWTCHIDYIAHFHFIRYAAQAGFLSWL
jgi:hypothetical protein